MTARPNQTSKKATVSKTATKTAATQSVETSTTSPAPKKTAAASAAGAATAPTVEKAAPKPSAPVGYVSFVGSGPGDPELLTVRAVELLREAEVVVTEVPSHIELVRTLLGVPAPRVVVDEDGNPVGEEPAGGPEFVDGGFGQDGQPLTHAARAKVVVKQAKSGRRVVRLMAGDPFVYASGPEEAQACVKAGIAFEIVPGVSSVTAVPAYAGIPLTTKNNREMAVVTCSDAKVDWSQYADNRTLVLLSAVNSIADIAKALVDAGRSADTPVSMTRVGTTTEQSTVVSTLDRIAADARAAKMSPPAITVVGDVVDLRGALSWFETKPLFGWRVLVPRTKEQAGALSARLRGYGAMPEEVPTIAVEPPRTPQQMDKAIKGLVDGRYEWIAFTSVNAVKAVREKFDEYGLDARAFAGVKIAAVGEETAAAIAACGLRADLVPGGEQSARGLLEDWPPYDEVLDPIDRVLLPRADIATETLVAGLTRAGLGGRRRHRLPDGARDAAAGRDPRGDQVRRVRRGAVHLVLDRAEPGRHRRQAARLDGRRGDRPRDGEDRRGVRPAGRRPRAVAVGAGPGRGARATSAPRVARDAARGRAARVAQGRVRPLVASVAPQEAT